MKIVIVRNNIVENIGTPPLGATPAGTTAHEFDGFVSIGWEWNNGAPADPNPPPPPPEAPPAPTPKEQLESRLGMTVAEINALLAAGQ